METVKMKHCYVQVYVIFLFHAKVHLSENYFAICLFYFYIFRAGINRFSILVIFPEVIQQYVCFILMYTT